MCEEAQPLLGLGEEGWGCAGGWLGVWTPSLVLLHACLLRFSAVKVDK